EVSESLDVSSLKSEPCRLVKPHPYPGRVETRDRVVWVDDDPGSKQVRCRFVGRELRRTRGPDLVVRRMVAVAALHVDPTRAESARKGARVRDDIGRIPLAAALGELHKTDRECNH